MRAAVVVVGSGFRLLSLVVVSLELMRVVDGILTVTLDLVVDELRLCVLFGPRILSRLEVMGCAAHDSKRELLAGSSQLKNPRNESLAMDGRRRTNASEDESPG